MSILITKHSLEMILNVFKNINKVKPASLDTESSTSASAEFAMTDRSGTTSETDGI